MIERFNFYDIYGYLLPGALLLGLGYLPVGIVTGKWPPAEFELALIGGIASYLLGHLLHITDRHLFTVTVAGKGSRDKEKTEDHGEEKGKKAAQSKGRYPHDLLLDEADTTFTPALKRQLAAQIQKKFRLKVTDGGDVSDGGLDRRRFDAFQLCRRWLIQEKSGSYAEQFEGLYELMRGVATGCLATMFLYFGWALASLAPLLGSQRRDDMGTLALVLVAIVASIVLRFPQRLFWCLAVILWSAGFITGGRLGIQGQEGVLLAGLGLLLAWAGWQFLGAFRTFAKVFAATVYRDFFVLAATERGGKREK